MKKSKTVTIDGIEYIPVTEVQSQAKDLNGMKYVIVRTQNAGVFAGYLEWQDKEEVIVVDARRLWYWDGASSLSQLAVDGVKRPENCKFPVEIPHIRLQQVIETIECTETARLSIKGVSIWQWLWLWL